MSKKESITIANYEMGNLLSVNKYLSRIDVSSFISDKPQDILKANRIILPGVGHFAKAVDNLKKSGLWGALNEAVLIKKVPVLGICLGVQLMAKHSEEGDVEGFGWIDAQVVRFNVKNKVRHKVPHIGWNNIQPVNNSRLFNGADDQNLYYFVHSYHLACNNKAEAAAMTTYDYAFVSAVKKDNIFGVQFHPEKSHDAGKKLFQNFAKL